MHAIRRDVLNLITANEKIQSLLLRGEAESMPNRSLFDPDP
jgi:hypothetical protein